MANIAQCEAECYISIEAECRVFILCSYSYSMWQANDLAKCYKELLKHSLATIKHTKFADFDDKLHQTWFCSNTLVSYPVLKGLRKTF